MAKLLIDLMAGSGGGYTTATFRRTDLYPDSLIWYTEWYPSLYDLSGNPLYDDSRWDVPAIWEAVSLSNDHVSYVIDCDNNLQGYIVLQVSNYHGIDGVECGHVNFLAAAPWNRVSTVRKRVYRQVGQYLLATAALVSYWHLSNATFELESLPDAENFYRKQGMVATGKIEKGLVQYRLGHTQAMPLLSQLSAKIRREARK